MVALLAALCGFAVAGMLPMANGLFVQALPNGFRARAFGVMATGIQVIQGVAVLVTGLLAERFPIPVVVGVVERGRGGADGGGRAALAGPADGGRRDHRRRVANAAPPPSGLGDPASDRPVEGTSDPHAGDGHRRHAVT